MQTNLMPPASHGAAFDARHLCAEMTTFQRAIPALYHRKRRLARLAVFLINAFFKPLNVVWIFAQLGLNRPFIVLGPSKHHGEVPFFRSTFAKQLSRRPRSFARVRRENHTARRRIELMTKSMMHVWKSNVKPVLAARVAVPSRNKAHFFNPPGPVFSLFRPSARGIQTNREWLVYGDKAPLSALEHSFVLALEHTGLSQRARHGGFALELASLL
mmetsp:Transcript_4850/g.15830  ORF Transcript_4850/g.15830 Transcript_4850/m.15830 type:complete len:215 (-) Transcript_4850:335-979(-)